MPEQTPVWITLGRETLLVWIVVIAAVRSGVVGSVGAGYVVFTSARHGGVLHAEATLELHFSVLDVAQALHDAVSGKL